MTLADLNPDALAELEAKLTRDLEMVRRVRALLLDHQLQRPCASSPLLPQVVDAMLNVLLDSLGSHEVNDEILQRKEDALE